LDDIYQAEIIYVKTPSTRQAGRQRSTEWSGEEERENIIKFGSEFQNKIKEMSAEAKS
jgi:hypothetical protein